MAMVCLYGNRFTEAFVRGIFTIFISRYPKVICRRSVLAIGNITQPCVFKENTPTNHDLGENQENLPKMGKEYQGISNAPRNFLTKKPVGYHGSLYIWLYPEFVQNLEVLENLWIWIQKFKPLKVLEFIKKYWKSFNSSYFRFLNFLKLVEGIWSYDHMINRTRIPYYDQENKNNNS